MSVWTGNPCRLCLHGNSRNRIPDDPLHLGTIFDASGVKVSTNDEFPQQLCNECLSFINQSRIFRKKCQESQNILLDSINKRKYCPDIKKEKFKKLLNQPNADRTVILIKPKIENINIKEDYDIEIFHDESKANILDNLSTANEQLIPENQEIFIDIKDLNLVKQNLNSDHVNSHSSNKDITLHNEDLNSESKELKEGSETINNANKILNKASEITNSIRKISKCNVCGKEMLAKSMPKHLNRHKVYGPVLKKGSKIKKKQLLVECDKCGKKMPKKHMLAHLLIHDGGLGKLICKHCGKIFDRPFGLLRHCRAKHGYEKVDKCSYCDFMGCSEYEVRIHEKLHTDDPFACEVCGKTFVWKSTWLQHRAEHGSPQILCSECPEIFKSTRQLYRHNLQKHKRPSNIIPSYQCPNCPHTALNKATIVEHMKKKHIATNTQDITKVYKNQSVDKVKKEVLKSRNKIKKRTLKTEAISTKSERVEDDSLNFLSAFHKHLNSDSETSQVKNADFNISKVKVEYLSAETPNTIDKNLNLQAKDLNAGTYLNTVSTVLRACERDFADDLARDSVDFKVESELTKNDDLNTANEDLSPDSEKANVDKKTIECDLCNKIMLKQYYPRHKKAHESNSQPAPPRKRAYVECERCGAMVQEHNFKEHMSMHLGTGKKISCEHCEQSFTRQSRLLRHCRASHGYEKTDLCSYCDYRGCSRAEVKLHERRHTDERPYVCSLCGVAFKLSASHKRHMLEKHGKGNVVQCELCPETFSTSRLLSSHKYVKHSKHTYSYECALCHKQYKHRGAARRHLAKHHNERNFIDKIVKIKLD